MSILLYLTINGPDEDLDDGDAIVEKLVEAMRVTVGHAEGWTIDMDEWEWD